MAAPEVTQELSYSKSFFEGLFQLPEGDRFRMCIQCGTCAGVCPFGPWMEYPPRKMIAALRMDEFEQVINSDSIWMCVACYACAHACPQQIPLTSGLMTRVKEELVLNGQVPAELQTALENSQRYGNPMGESPKKRADWAKDIKPPVPIMGEIKRPVDVLWFVGDYSSYHPKAQEVARAFVKVMRALKIDFGILGPEEMSDGDSQRMAGESGLFEWLARKNERALMKYEFKQIVTTDPHAYNALKNDYPSLGIEYPVMHYTQFLAECLDQLKPLLRKSVEALVTYHDPCYLGRVNGIYDEPRQLLRAIPGVIFVEMSHHLDDSLCCGGGGGGMWLDGFRWEKSESRLTEWRVREVVASRPVEDFMSVLGDLRRPKRGAVEAVPEVSILAVACPYEKPRFEDATKAVPEAKSLIVKDLAELLAESMGLL